MPTASSCIPVSRTASHSTFYLARLRHYNSNSNVFVFVFQTLSACKGIRGVDSTKGKDALDGMSGWMRLDGRANVCPSEKGGQMNGWMDGCNVHIVGSMVGVSG